MTIVLNIQYDSCISPSLGNYFYCRRQCSTTTHNTVGQFLHSSTINPLRRLSPVTLMTLDSYDSSTPRHTYTYTHTLIHTYTYTYKHIHTHTHTHTHIHTHTYTHIHTHIHTHTNIYLHTHTHTHTHTYTHIHTHTCTLDKWDELTPT